MVKTYRPPTREEVLNNVLSRGDIVSAEIVYALKLKPDGWGRNRIPFLFGYLVRVRWGESGSVEEKIVYRHPDALQNLQMTKGHGWQPVSELEELSWVAAVAEENGRRGAPGLGWTKDAQLSRVRAEENPPTDKLFSPSYEADSQTAYDERVFAARDRIEAGEPEPGDKRWEHVQIHGGRRAARGRVVGTDRQVPDHDIIGQTPETQQKLEKRLEAREQPWEARTQSPGSYQRAREREETSVKGQVRLELQRQIKNALQTYIEQSRMPGLVVPDTVWPLLEVGMPERAAQILVSRAAGHFYPLQAKEIGKTQWMPKIAGAKLDVMRSLGRPLALRPDGRVVLPLPGTRARDAELKQIALVRADGKARVVVTDAQLGQQFDAYRERIERERTYRAEDSEAFLDRVYNLLITAGSTVPDAHFLFRFRFRGEDSEQRVTFRPTREHSKVRDAADSQKGVEYKSLKNVDLTDLPRLLARLSQRTKKKGRKLEQINVRGNSMARKKAKKNYEVLPDYWFEQYKNGQYGPRRWVPAARRNQTMAAKKSKKSKRSRKARRNAVGYAPRVRAERAVFNPYDAPADVWWMGQRAAAAEPGDYQDFWHNAPYRIGPLNYRAGQFSASKTGGWEPVNRRNPKQGKRKAEQEGWVVLIEDEAVWYPTEDAALIGMSERLKKWRKKLKRKDVGSITVPASKYGRWQSMPSGESWPSVKRNTASGLSKTQQQRAWLNSGQAMAARAMRMHQNEGISLKAAWARVKGVKENPRRRKKSRRSRR